MNSHDRPTTCECRHSPHALHCETWNERLESNQRSNWVLGHRSINLGGRLLQDRHTAQNNGPSLPCQPGCVRLLCGAPLIIMWRSHGHDLREAPLPPDRTAEHHQFHHYWSLLPASPSLARSCLPELSRWAHYRHRPVSPRRKSA